MLTQSECCSVSELPLVLPHGSQGDFKTQQKAGGEACPVSLCVVCAWGEGIVVVSTALGGPLPCSLEPSTVAAKAFWSPDLRFCLW